MKRSARPIQKFSAAISLLPQMFSFCSNLQPARESGQDGQPV